MSLLEIGGTSQHGGVHVECTMYQTGVDGKGTLFFNVLRHFVPVGICGFWGLVQESKVLVMVLNEK